MANRALYSAGFIVALTSVLACDPIASMSGSVHRADRSPVAGASVTIECSSLDSGRITATTDSQGRFSATKIGCFDKMCNIDVAVTGEPIRSFPSAQYCTGDCDQSCPRAIEADLTIPDVSSH